MTTVRELFGVHSSLAPVKGFVCGVEHEIENVSTYDNLNTQYFHVESDHSLRNNGVEFISNPLSFESQLSAFDNLHGTIKYQSSGGGVKSAFTDRTSVHVHVNCLDLSAEAAKSLALWYALFEPVFFTFVDKKRSNSIYCVPLDQTLLPSSYDKSLHKLVGMWSKYTAFNLLPLKTQGTIEFRHMHGTNDKELFKEWLTAIKQLWEYAQTNYPSKLTLKKDSFVREAFDQIFKSTRAASIGSSVTGLVENNLIDLKLSFL